MNFFSQSCVFISEKILFVGFVAVRESARFNLIMRNALLHLLELTEFSCLMWCRKMTIHMQMGILPTSLTRRYHVRNWSAITMKQFVTQFTRHCYHTQQNNHRRTILKATLGYRYERRSMKALRNHFALEVNATRNISKSDRFHDSLYIIMKFQCPLNSSLPSSRRCTFFWRRWWSNGRGS